MTASPSHGKCDDQQETRSSSIGKENQETDRNETIKDHERCAECGRPLASSSQIIDIGQHSTRWHPECFKCAICHEPMDREQSCHLYRDQVICRDDFSRLKNDNAIHCARCRWPISATDWVHRAGSQVYHIACFNCDICSRQLNTGEQFILCPQHRPVPGDQSGEKASVRLLCCQHFNLDTQNKHLHYGSNANSSDHLVTDSESPAQDEQRTHRGYRKGLSKQANQYPKLVNLSTVPSTSAPRDSPAPIDQPDAPHRDHKHNELIFMEQQHRDPAVTSSISAGESAIEDNQHLTVTTSATANLPSSSTSSSSSTTSSLHTGDYLSPMTPTNSSQSGLPCKSKRVRTTFTEDQLSILQTHFQIDSNPDGQDLERIATITGLSKRVTQVWFQNSRARQKKYLIKKKPILGSSVSDPMAGFSMSGAVSRQAFQPMELYTEFSEPEAIKDHIESSRLNLTRGWCQAVNKTARREDAVLKRAPPVSQGHVRNLEQETICKDPNAGPSNYGEHDESFLKAIDEDSD